MAITYDAPSNTITVTGYTEEVPCTFEDVYQADVSGGWGVVLKQGSKQYHFDAKLQIGDGSTASYFGDKEVQIEIADIDSVNYEKIIYIRKNSYFTMGTLIDETDKSTKEGVQFISLLDHTTPAWHQAPYLIATEWTSTGKVSLYSCSFIGIATRITFDLRYGTNRVWTCIANNGTIGEGADVFGTFISDTPSSIFSFARSGTYEKIDIFNCSQLLWTQQAYVFSLKNIYMRGNTYIAAFSGTWTGSGNLINVDADIWAFNFGAGATGKVYRQYEFDVHCQDKEGNDLSGVSVVAEYSVSEWDLLGEIWDALGTWVKTGSGVSEISPVGQLHLIPDNGTFVGRQKELGDLPNNFTVEMKLKVDIFGGHLFKFQGNTGSHAFNVNIFDTYIQVYLESGGWISHSIVTDNDWHVWRFVVDAENGVTVYRDGIFVHTFVGELWVYTPNDGRVEVLKWEYVGGEAHQDYVNISSGLSPAFSTSTDANGDIVTQIVDHGWFERAYGNTEQLKTPLKVTYSKAGYQTVIKYYDLEEKTKDAVVLHKAVGVFISLGTPVVNLKKTDPENKNVLVL